MTTLDDDHLLTRVRLATDATGVGTTPLERDFDEARFHIHLVIVEAAASGIEVVKHAARCVHHILGPAGRSPQRGVGFALHELSGAIEGA